MGNTSGVYPNGMQDVSPQEAYLYGRPDNVYGAYPKGVQQRLTDAQMMEVYEVLLEQQQAGVIRPAEERRPAIGKSVVQFCDATLGDTVTQPDTGSPQNTAVKHPAEQIPERETNELEPAGTAYHTPQTKHDDSSYREKSATESELRAILQHTPLPVGREERKVLQYDSKDPEDDKNDDVSEARHWKERTKTDAKTGTTRHPSRQINGAPKRASDPANAKVGSTQHTPPKRSTSSSQSVGSRIADHTNHHKKQLSTSTPRNTSAEELEETTKRRDTSRSEKVGIPRTLWPPSFFVLLSAALRQLMEFEHGAPKNPNGDAHASNYRQPEATRHTAPSAYSGVSSTPLNSRGPHPASHGKRSSFAQPPNGYGMNRNSNFYQAVGPDSGSFNYENPTHRARECPVSSAGHRRPKQQSAPPLQLPTLQQPDVRPMKNRFNKQDKTCMWVKYRQHKLSALIDTGSDVSIAGEDIARHLGWTIRAHHTNGVSIANNKTMSILGATRVVLVVAGHGIELEILITPDLDGLILGIARLRGQGRIRWDFDRGKIKFHKQNWIELQQETERPCWTGITRKNFPITDLGTESGRSDFHAAPTSSARRFCCSTFNRKFLREVTLFCRTMHQVESR